MLNCHNLRWKGRVPRGSGIPAAKSRGPWLSWRKIVADQVFIVGVFILQYLYDLT
jgi:hypothetical protein